jgi:hypothetical protein
MVLGNLEGLIDGAEALNGNDGRDVMLEPPGLPVEAGSLADVEVCNLDVPLRGRILKQHLMSGEWFAVSPQAAKAAVDKGIIGIEEERSRKREESSKARGYTAPEWIQTPSWVRDGIVAVALVAGREITGEKKEYLIAKEAEAQATECQKYMKVGLDSALSRLPTKY